MNSGRILAIDDEQNIRHLIQSELTLEGFEVATARSGEEGLRLLDGKVFDVVLLDLKLPRMNGLEVLRRLKYKFPGTEVIMITGYGDIKTAVESLKLGAREYITKPFKLDELLALVKQAVSNHEVPAAVTAPPLRQRAKEKAQPVICPSGLMQPVYDTIARVAPTDQTVLIQGETGVGKDVVALQIHLSSRRRHGHFVTVDCGLLNKNLAESEMYGHGKGAFSGATEKKLGLVEKSHEGTLFLDEIGNMDLDIQKKFLRFLETSKFRRVGETKEVQVDTRFILASNLDLNEAVRKGLLRQDLFYRMDVINITVPPLRSRPEDIGYLAEYFVKVDGDHERPLTLDPETIRVLGEYGWPGNVRELRSVISKTIIFARSDVIKPSDLPSHIFANRKAAASEPKTLEDMEKAHIMAVLHEAGGNQSKAAEILGINRKTLYKKIHRYHIFS